MKWIVLVWTCLIGYGVVWHITQTQMPSSDNEAATVGWVLGLFFALAFYLIVWLLGALPLYLISRMFGRRDHA